MYTPVSRSNSSRNFNVWSECTMPYLGDANRKGTSLTLCSLCYEWIDVPVHSSRCSGDGRSLSNLYAWTLAQSACSASHLNRCHTGMLSPCNLSNNRSIPALAHTFEKLCDDRSTSLYSSFGAQPSPRQPTQYLGLDLSSPTFSIAFLTTLRIDWHLGWFETSEIGCWATTSILVSFHVYIYSLHVA